MRTYEEYRTILELWEREPNKKKISRLTGIPRRTVIECIQRYGSVTGLEAQKERASKSTADLILKRISEDQEVSAAYSYLFGLYLGDGSISLTANGRTYKLRITLDKKYPNIISSCAQAISVVLPQNKVNGVAKLGCIDVTCHNKHMPEIFPQHGAGPKHLREIKLADWQQTIIKNHPLEFFRGLYHSDGSRSRNIVKGKDYPRYLFSNESAHIRQFFCDTCDRLGLYWTVASQRNICISRREDVDYLDRIVGSKN